MQQVKGEERREFQRLELDDPIEGTFGLTPVTVLEVGVLGSRVRHKVPLDENRGELRFTFEEKDIAIRCDVVRTVEAGDLSGSMSGLRFLAAIGDSGDHLRMMLGRLVTRAIEKRREPTGERARVRGIDGDRTVRGVHAQFVCFRFENGAWRRRPVFLPEQPSVGFTVARQEDPEEMQSLCAVYEASDEEGRRLIRLFAELSVSEVLQIPPRSAPTPPEA